MTLSGRVLYSLCIRAGSTVLAFASVLVLTRLLGAETFGVYAVALTVASVLALPAQAGARLMLVRDIAVAHEAGDAARIRAVRRDVGRFASLLSVLIAVVGAAVVYLTIRDDWRAALGVAMVSIPLLALSAIWGAALQGAGRVIHAQIGLQILRPLVVILLGVAAMVALSVPPTAAGAIVFHLIALGVAAAYSIAVLRRDRTAPGGPEAPAMSLGSVAVATGGLSLVAALITLNGAVGILLLGALADPTEAALYRVANSAAALVLAAQVSVNQVIAPRIAAMNDRQAFDGLQGILTWSVRVGVLIGLGVGLMLTLSGPVLLLAFGAEFPASFVPMVTLIAGNVALLCAGPGVLILTMTGHERAVSRGLLWGLGINLLLGAVLIPVQGAQGAAIAAALSGVVWNGYLCLHVRRLLGLRPGVWETGPR